VGSTWDGIAPGYTDIELDFSSGDIDPLVFELKQASGKWILGFKGDASGRWCWHVHLQVKNKISLACHRKYVIIYPSVPFAKTCPATPVQNVPTEPDNVPTEPDNVPTEPDNCPIGQIYDSYVSKCKDGCSTQEF
jgi:hypothetical protein